MIYNNQVNIKPLNQNKMNQTAVEWIEQQLIDGTMRPVEIIAIAKQMEKEQIMDAYNQGCNDYDELGHKRIEQYYNEKYGKDEIKTD